MVSPEDDEQDHDPDTEVKDNDNVVNDNQRVTRSKTHSLPKPINRLQP